MVYQEIWGMVGLHYAIRALMCEAAETIKADPANRRHYAHDDYLTVIKQKPKASPGSWATYGYPAQLRSWI